MVWLKASFNQTGIPSVMVVRFTKIVVARAIFNSIKIIMKQAYWNKKRSVLGTSK